MTILGIETSCDETSVAVVENGTNLLAHTLASSQQLHEKYKGIVPDRAAREQLKYILPTLHETLKVLGERPIDALAVTVGPGLIGSLLIGIETAKALALTWNKPLIPVNHLVGHIYANWITNYETSQLSLATGRATNQSLLTNDQSPITEFPHNSPKLPAVVLIVSGGHTDLVYMKDHGNFDYLGGTLDDATGECFDKCGRLLGLPYPYGPYIEAEASKFIINSSGFIVKLPRPMMEAKGFDFSFSGLKTAFIKEFNRLRITNYDLLTPHLAYELQEAITDVLVAKTIRATQKFQPKSIIVAGGVAANKRLREKLQFEISHQSPVTSDQSPVTLYIPPSPLCTDNAVYIASCAYFNYQPLPLNLIDADPDLSVKDLKSTSNI